MNRVAALVAAVSRGVVGLIAGVAALVGLSEPASPTWVIAAVTVNCLWAALFVYVALARGLASWVLAGEVALTALLCLFQTRLAGSEPLSDGSSWLGVQASVTVVVVHLGWRWIPGIAAGAVVAGSYALGAAHLPGHGIYQVTNFSIQIGATAAFMAVIRRASRAADLALADYQRGRQAEAVEQARRAEKREQNRRLHDTVLATLTMVGMSAIAKTSRMLQDRAAADLQVIDRLGSTADVTDEVAFLDLHLRHVVERAQLHVDIDADCAACAVPAKVAEAIAAAASEALANVKRHSGARTAQVRLSQNDGVLVEVIDAGIGFDPMSVPTHRYGIREAIIGRMNDVGGSAEIGSRPGEGTRVTLRWPHA